MSVSVVTHGAVGNGTADDTAAFAAAFAAVNDSGRPGTVVVPPPAVSYRIGSFTLEPKVAIEVVGERSRIRRLPNIKSTNYGGGVGDYFTSMMLITNTTLNPHDSLGYYPRVTFRNIIFDGDREHQTQDSGGTVWDRGYGNEMMHGVNVEAPDTQPWRQPVWFIECDFEWFGGEGVSIFRNASVHLERCRFYACFRGAFHIVGHWVELVARDCVSDDPWDTDDSAPNSGIGTEFEAEGYRRSNKIHIDGWDFHQGFVNVAFQGDAEEKSGQQVAPLLPNERNEAILRRIVVHQSNKAEQVHFYSSGEANFRISDSTFYGGRQTSAGDPDLRRTMIDGRNIEVDKCTFIASNNGLAAGTGGAQQFIACWVRDLYDYTAGHYGHRFTNCDFMLDETCLNGSFNGASVALAAPVHAISNSTTALYQTRNAPWLGGVLPANTVFENCRFRVLKYYANRNDNPGVAAKRFLFNYLLFPHYGNSWQFINCDGWAVRGFRLMSNPAGLPGVYELVGGRYVVEDVLFESDYGGDAVEEFLAVRFSGHWGEDRYNHLSGTLPVPYGGREILVSADPTASSPVTVTDRLLIESEPTENNIYRVRLEGTPLIAGTLVIRNLTTGAQITFNSGGTAAAGSAGTGTLNATTGWVQWSWNTPPDGLDKIVHSYQHGNQVPGFLGDVAVLKSNPGQRWVCTVADAADATWVAVGTGGGGGGAVASVFGRTGAVAAQTGDYTPAQVLPTFTGHGGQFLGVNSGGTAVEWATPAGGAAFGGDFNAAAAIDYTMPAVPNVSGLLNQAAHGGRPCHVTGTVTVPVVDGFTCELANKSGAARTIQPASGNLIHAGTTKASLQLSNLRTVVVRGDGTDVWVYGAP